MSHFFDVIIFMNLSFPVYIVVQVYWQNGEYFMAREVFGKKVILMNILSTTQKRNSSEGKLWGVFSVRCSKNHILNENFKPQMLTIRPFFPNTTISSNKRVRETFLLLPPPLVVSLKIYITSITGLRSFLFIRDLSRNT